LEEEEKEGKRSEGEKINGSKKNKGNSPLLLF
jgi:hypothetical protein